MHVNYIHRLSISHSTVRSDSFNKYILKMHFIKVTYCSLNYNWFSQGHHDAPVATRWKSLTPCPDLEGLKQLKTQKECICKNKILIKYRMGFVRKECDKFKNDGFTFNFFTSAFHFSLPFCQRRLQKPRLSLAPSLTWDLTFCLLSPSTSWPPPPSLPTRSTSSAPSPFLSPAIAHLFTRSVPPPPPPPSPSSPPYHLVSTFPYSFPANKRGKKAFTH